MDQSLRILLTWLLIIGGAIMSHAQPKRLDLPNGTVVVETRNLANVGHTDRSLVLWMLNPKKNPNGYSADEPYTCPDYSRGSYLSGPARVSLINSKTNTLINTANIAGSDGEATLDLPYAIRSGYHYRVQPAPRRGIEAKPTIMWLRDYNGDGKALEFVLFDAVACMGLPTALIGYSEKQDRVILYPAHLKEIEGTKRKDLTTFWVDYLLSKKPTRAGYWKYDVDYRGRGGALVQWEVRYDKTKEQFEGTMTVTPGEPED